MCSSSGGQNCITQPLVSSHADTNMVTLTTIWLFGTMSWGEKIKTHRSAGREREREREREHDVLRALPSTESASRRTAARGEHHALSLSAKRWVLIFCLQLMVEKRHSVVNVTIFMSACDETRGCVMQFWPPDDEHMCSKHVEAWNKLTVKQKYCASSWLNTEINILRCKVNKTSKQWTMFRTTNLRVLLVNVSALSFRRGSENSFLPYEY